MNNYFALINPDAVFNSQATGILENFVRAGLEIVSTLVYELDKEEVALIFYSRRHDSDFDDFCEHYTSGESWLVHFRGKDLSELAKFLTEAQIAAIHIPELKVDHSVLLKMTASLGYDRSKLDAVVKDLRQKLTQIEEHGNRAFASLALEQSQKLFAYYISLQVAGFTKQQAFELVVNAQVGEEYSGPPPTEEEEKD